MKNKEPKLLPYNPAVLSMTGLTREDIALMVYEAGHALVESYMPDLTVKSTYEGPDAATYEVLLWNIHQITDAPGFWPMYRELWAQVDEVFVAQYAGLKASHEWLRERYKGVHSVGEMEHTYPGADVLEHRLNTITAAMLKEALTPLKTACKGEKEAAHA